MSYPNDPNEIPDYVNNPQRLYEDSAEAINDPQRWAEIQAIHVQQQIDARVGAYRPMLDAAAAASATDSLSAEVKAFRQSPAFEHALERFPAHKRAIALAEQNPTLAGELPGLVEAVYYAARGLGQAAPPQASPAATPDLRTPEGRQALIRAFEASGKLDQPL